MLLLLINVLIINYYQNDLNQKFYLKYINLFINQLIFKNHYKNYQINLVYIFFIQPFKNPYTFYQFKYHLIYVNSFIINLIINKNQYLSYLFI